MQISTMKTRLYVCKITLGVLGTLTTNRQSTYPYMAALFFNCAHEGSFVITHENQLKAKAVSKLIWSTTSHNK
mgnify:CR=1 FL=1